MFLIVAGFWIYEMIRIRNDFTSPSPPLWKYWVVPVAFIAFCYPANPTTFTPDFAPSGIVTNMAGLTFCMMTPVYLAILTLHHPRVNIPTLRVTALVGLIIAFYNMWVCLAPMNCTTFWIRVAQMMEVGDSTCQVLTESMKPHYWHVTGSEISGRPNPTTCQFGF